MGQVCQICNHPNRLEIDREIVKGISHTKIARMFNVSNQSVRAHAHNHLSRQMVKHQEIQERLQSQGLLDEIEELLKRSKHILRKAEKDNKLNIALSAIRETRGTLELLCRIAATMHQIRAQELEQARLEQEEEDRANTILIDPKALPVETLLDVCGLEPLELEQSGQLIGFDLDPSQLSDEQLMALINADNTDPLTGAPMQAHGYEPVEVVSRPERTRTTCPEPEPESSSSPPPRKQRGGNRRPQKESWLSSEPEEVKVDRITGKPCDGYRLPS